ncbi:MAG: hypothetical protein RIQ79_2584 [Verrucomicrobiota bacterium]
MNATSIVDSLFSLFGYARVRFPQDVGIIFSVLGDLDAIKCGESGMPTASTNYYYLVRGRKIKLTIEDYEDTILTGPKAIVKVLSERIAEEGTRR